MTARSRFADVEKRYGRVQALAGRRPRRRAGRVLRPARAERRRQDHADHDPRRPGARRRAARVARDGRTTSSPTTARARRALGVVPQELVFDPFFTVRETLRIQSGYFGLRGNDAWIDEIMHHLDLTAKADANMRSLSGGMKRRVLVGAGAGAQAAGDRARRADRGRRRRAAPGPVAVHPRLNRDGHTIVLTTHYLEEAEALCSRIAMLKAGRIVALDSTHNLLAALLRLARSRVRLGRDALPDGACAAACVAPSDGAVRAALSDCRELEHALARLREAGVDDRASMELEQPDLEQVFLQIMTRCETALDDAASPTLFYKELLRFWKVSFQTIAAPVLTALLYLLVFAHVLEGRVQVFDGRALHRVPGAGPGDDERAAERLRQQLVQPDPVQDHRQHRLRAAAAALARASSSPPTCSASMVRGLVVGAGVFAVTVVVRRAAPARRRSGRSPSRCSARAARRARPHRRHLGGQVRPARRVPELRHRAAHVPVGRVLLDPFAAAVLAGAVALQPVLLHDRRLPLRLLRRRPTSRPG